MTADLQSEIFWEAQRLEPGDWRVWDAGTLRLWAKRDRHEWRVFSRREPEEREELTTGQSEEPPADASWNRWAFREEDAVIQLLPAMPALPVVVRPESPIRIPRGKEVLFFVSVPISLQLYIGPGRETFVYEEPTAVLSKTWFGEPTFGELCYALRTGASRSLEGIKKGRHRAVCPVRIRNRSEEELDFQKICIRTLYVSIYRGASRLWTSEVEVGYLGKNHFSEIAFGKEAPRHEPVKGLLGPAREIAPRGFIKKSFESLWSF